jgi:hypothetical protein
MSDHSSLSEPSDYMREAAAQDALLDEKLVRIRAQVDLGTITTREAADLRIRAMEHHLATTRALRIEYFGGS